MNLKLYRMLCSVVLYTCVFLATAFDQKSFVATTTPESTTQHQLTRGCILPGQPIGGSFELKCAGSLCDDVPGEIIPSGSILNYRCGEGYILKGNSMTFCYFNTWYMRPTCVKTCPALSVEGADAVCRYQGEIVSCKSRVVPETKAILACKEHYKIRHGEEAMGREINCLEGGKWSQAAFQCILECGRAVADGNDLISNTSTVEHSHFPWHVGIYKKESNGNFRHICGGTLISPDLVVSAAHCFYDETAKKLTSVSKFSVASGKFYRSYDVLELYAQKSTVKTINITERYFGSIRNYEQDIALVRLETPLTMSKLVRPVCMDWYNRHEREQLWREKTGKAVWWSETANESTSTHLQEIDLPYIPFRNCLTAVSADFKGLVTPDKFCAGSLNGSRPRDGDAGGGLYFPLDGLWYLRGITSVGLLSNGMHANNTYTTFTNVRHFLKWIRDAYLNVRPNGLTSSLEHITASETLVEGIHHPSKVNATVGCILPDQPTGGSFDLDLCAEAGDRVAIGSILIYRCVEGYALIGNNVSVCYGNVWNPPTTCVKTCPALESKNVDFVCKYNDEIVSCGTAVRPGTKATLACKELYETPPADDPVYREITCLEGGVWDRSVFHCFPECGNSEAVGSSLNTNGSTVNHVNFPWYVDIYKRSFIGNVEQICAGTLVSPDLIVSAAHCFYDESMSEFMDASWFTVATGKYDHFHQVSDTYAQNSVIKQIYVAERYIGSIGKHAHDIALIRLEVPFNTTTLVKPICIDWDNKHHQEQLKLGKSGKALGRSYRTARMPNTELQVITHPYVPYHECVSAFATEYASFITADKFCAGYSNGTGLCVGDTGGGLYFQSDGLWYLRGIASFRPEIAPGTCNSSYYTTFTSVGYFVEWIQKAFSSTSSTKGCTLPEQPTAGSFELGSCKGQCNLAPGTRVPIGSFLVYRCSEGYTLRGRNVTICYDDAWYQPPTCIQNRCPALTSESVNFDCRHHQKKVSCQSAIAPGTKATLSCKTWHSLPFYGNPGYREITCLNNGTWDRKVFECIPECGRAVNGSNVDSTQFPWIVAIYKRSVDKTFRFSTFETLVSPNLVISTAYYILQETVRKVNASEYAVSAGKYNYHTVYDDPDPDAQKSLLSQIIIADGYLGKKNYYANNVALLQLETPFKITTLVTPICIDWHGRLGKELIASENDAKIGGWIRRRPILHGHEARHITRSYISREKCFSLIAESSKIYVAADTFCFDCSSDLDAYNHMTASGYESHGHWYLLGFSGIKLVSVGHPDAWIVAFTKIDGYLDWIHAASTSYNA